MKLKNFIILLLFIFGIVALGIVVFVSLTGDFEVAYSLQKLYLNVINFLEGMINSFNKFASGLLSKFRY